LDKVEPLLKRFPQDSFVVRIELGKTSDHHEKGKIFKAEGHIALPQRPDVYAESVEEDLYAAIDLMTDGLKRQLLKEKDKHLTARKTKEE
jgi:ribosomal subunit interface protein